jgi:hypothetical protein
VADIEEVLGRRQGLHVHHKDARIIQVGENGCDVGIRTCADDNGARVLRAVE